MDKNYNLIWEALSRAEFGSISINLPDSQIREFTGSKPGPQAQITIYSPDLIEEVITGGDVAFGESYIEKKWDSQNLSDLLTYLTLNAHALEEFFHARKLRALLLFLSSFFTRNTKRGSKKNIKAHYDLGNDFYELWLDESMTYSSALFDEKDCSLEQAQHKKYHNILSKLNPGSVLEIGCGWGGFAHEAALKKHDVTCLTISPKQRDYALKRIEKNNLGHKVKIKLQDYREEKDSYDNIVSIEMFEAVGRQYCDKYFTVIKNSLKTRGKAVLQTITIDEEVFRDYVKRVDFIQKHIFPGGFLPSKTTIRQLAKKHDLIIRSETAFGLDYAKTLQIWQKNFDAKSESIKQLGFNEEFMRKWHFYFSYCIAGFSAKRTDVVQFEIEKI